MKKFIKKHKALFVIICVLFVAIAAVSVYFIFFNKKEEVKAKAWQELQNYEEKLMEKGVQISANNVKIEIDHKTCISKGFLEIIQKTGTESPVERLEVPAERTAEDD